MTALQKMKMISTIVFIMIITDLRHSLPEPCPEFSSINEHIHPTEVIICCIVSTTYVAKR